MIFNNYIISCRTPPYSVFELSHEKCSCQVKEENECKTTSMTIDVEMEMEMQMEIVILKAPKASCELTIA